MKAQPERTCIACRKKGKKGELIRLAASPAGVIIDYTEKLPGRGAYVCPERECIDKLLKPGAGSAVSRALKQNVSLPVKEDFYNELEEKVRKKTVSLLGMARKAGLAEYGFDAAAGACGKLPGGVMVVSEDLAENSRKKLIEKMDEETVIYNFSDKEALGAVIGSAPVGIIYVKPSELSRSLARELSRLLKVSRG